LSAVKPATSAPPVQPLPNNPTVIDASFGQPADPPVKPPGVSPPLAGGAGSPQPDDCVTSALDPKSTSRMEKAVCQIGRDISNQLAGNKLSADNSGKQVMTILAGKLTPNKVKQSFFIDAEKKRTDKQVGSGPQSAGTTSLVVKGGAPALIGWAVEHGAATSSFSDNTVTTRFNPMNLAKAVFFNQGLIQIREVQPRDDAFDRFLRSISIGVSFDITRGVETPTFTARPNQISAVSFRYEFLNHRNPLSRRHDKLREDFFYGQESNFNQIAAAILKMVDRGTGRFQNPVLNEWLDETNKELAKIPAGLSPADRRSQVTAVIEAQVDKLPIDRLSVQGEIQDAVDRFADGSIGFKEARDDLLEEINDGQVATFEYTNHRDPIAPDTSNFRFIWEKGLFRKTDFTFNSSLTIYNKEPKSPDIRRIRDFQFAAQTDTKLGSLAGGDMLLSFAGRYERLNSDVIDPLGIVTPGTRGDVAIGQIKFTIPIADWGIKLPLSLTFANRTELIKESTVRANFGFTFDLDPIFARLKAFRP